MEVAKYTRLALDNFDFQHPGAFYGEAGERSLGAGLIYSGVVFPLYDPNTRAFDTAEGVAYILTHECDIDQANQRHFNDQVVICPLIPLDALVAEYETESLARKV